MVAAYALKVLVTFLTVIDPIGLVPLVLGITGGYPEAMRQRIVTKAVLIAGGVIAVFGIFGRFILESLGISLYAFNIAGGGLLFLVAIDMLFGRQSGARETASEEEEALSREDVSTFPLAIPLIAGPGTIASTILLVTSAGTNAMQLSAIAFAAIFTLALAWLAMLLSGWIEQRVSKTGITVLSRILGMVLAALAVQFILNGITQFVIVLR